MRSLRLQFFCVFICLLFSIASAWGEPRTPETIQHPLTGYAFQFPRDHYAHNDYQVEWWYFTGNLQDAAGKEYGYQCSFFRVSLAGMKVLQQYQKTPSQWDNGQIYFAHMTVADLDGKHFHFYERINRPGLGMAGAAADHLEVWNENWKLAGDAAARTLVAHEAQTGFDLQLVPEKAPVVHGTGEDKPKWDLPEQAPNYYSLTRMKTTGTITIDGRPVTVTGTSWMDHVFAERLLVPEQTGWDWFSLKLDNDTEIMLLRLRMQDGNYDPRSGGTLVLSDGTAAHLPSEKYSVEVLEEWTSPKSGVTYPAAWRVTLPARNITLKVVPDMAAQELFLLRSISNSYWEGSVTVEGEVEGRSVSGKGYVELVGYGGNLSGALGR
ncbi:lipocalin-like domain-containing protein [Nitrospina watsonii]|uniref:AttH component of AttEFGH ABC transport system n=1 Tax=Nitrospina watsonii TaxID=1323948 RepID=A0ABM9HG78_9BACT|nr:lipocalin-like domain-containing protein [Nitrospina watsonii]CAI2719213.1 AttH component of AttEFGH ABC transport system [Nitrospina watsonii]